MRVMIADDHLLIRAGLKSLLASLPHVEVVGEASDEVGEDGRRRPLPGRRDGQPEPGRVEARADRERRRGPAAGHAPR